MPNYYVEFTDGKRYYLWGSDKEAAKARAHKKYKRKNGKSGHIKRVR